MASHNRTSSDASTLTDLSDSVGDKSTSSGYSAASVTSNDFKLKVDGLIANKDLKTEKLESRARGFIKDLKDSGEYDIPLHGGSSFQKEVKLHRVLTAMLDFAFDCGKDNGKRYTVCAICACDLRVGEGNEMKLEYLQSLSTTWLSHLLFVFKANSSHRGQQNPTPSAIATPTLNETAGHLDEGADKDWPANFRDKVISRDGYRCVVTGCYDTKHPQVPEDQHDEQVYLEASHILRRAIAVFKGPSENSDEYLSALTTFDILRHYADMPIKSIEDMTNIIDDPSNGMALQADAHTGFDKFNWSLKETEIPNQYTTVIYGRGHGITKSGAGKTVTFTDHSRDFEEPSSPPRKKLRLTPTGIGLPNPLFIRIHCAIAGVLHMSGAGESIDRALDRAGKSTAGVIFTGADFAHVGLTEDLGLVGLVRQITVR